MKGLLRSLVVLSVIESLDALTLTRRGSIHYGAVVAGAMVVKPPRAYADSEWECKLDKKDWNILKKQESSIRIRPETMLSAVESKAEKREVKLLKIPLGRGALTSFEPEEQIDLSRFFSSRADAERITAKRIAEVYRRSLERQAAAPESPLLNIALDDASALVENRGGKRYVLIDYKIDGCRKIDEDGACVGRSAKAATAVITVSLESQARTLEEQRRMDSGEMEQRYIDTLWIFQANQPLIKGRDLSSTIPGPETYRALHDIANCFQILD